MNRSDGQAEVTAIDERAADWLTRRDAGLSAAERREFDDWLAADRRHRDAYAAMEAAWRVVTQPSRRGLGQEVLDELAARNVRRRRRSGWSVVLAGMAAAAVAFLWLRPASVPVAPVNELTRFARAGVIARPERQVLADGSAVELKAGAEFEAVFSEGERRVRLTRGTAHFAVTKDPRRPFVVVAGATAVRAIGTEFVVQFAATNVDVLVTEGLVQVASSTETLAADPVLVSAGRRAVVVAGEKAFARPEVEIVPPAAMANALAWRTQRVEFSGLPLADVIAVFNRVNAVQLTLVEPDLAGLRVSGIYWTDNPVGFAQLIAASFELRVEQPSASVIALRR